MTAPISIVVAEDEFLTLEGICSLLEREPDLEVVGRANSGETALEFVEKNQPQILLLDIRMPPGIDGIEVIKRLRKRHIPVRIIALTQEYQLIEAVKAAGANGYVPKDEHHMFIPTIRCVAETGSEVFINPKVSQSFQLLKERMIRAELNPMETSVWQLLSFKNEEIARRLSKSPGRIRNLISDLYFKLDIQDMEAISRRVQATEMARLLGILEGPKI